jgi:hypothetical protein
MPISDARVSSLLHVTTSSCHSIGYREIATSNATIPLYAKSPKCRTPTPLNPWTRVPQIGRLRPCREIADRDSIVQEFHDSGNSDMPNPDSSGSSDTRPRNERLRSHRGSLLLSGIFPSGNRHLRCRDPLSSRIPDSRSPMVPFSTP